MEFRILGPLQVEDRGVPVALGGPKQRSVLALLLLDANHVVSVDRLVDGVWGERPPARAASTLQVYVANLRKVLEPGRAPGSPPTVLRTQAPGYQLAVEPQQLDLTRFEALAAEGRKALEAGRARPASVLLREGLSLWRGRPLEDLPSEVFGPGELARLEEMRIGVIEDRVDADLASGRHGEVVGELESLVARYSFREHLGAQWMLALYRAERQADALAAFQTIRDRLVEELGVEPGAELRALESAILAQDPALAAPSAVPLDHEEVERLLRAATGRVPDRATVERIRVETGGNAVAVEVAVRDELTRLTTHRLAGSIVEAGVTSGDLVRATETAAEYVLAVQQSRRAGVVIPVVRPPDPEGTPPAPVACPYKGLMRYDAEDAVWFHGRERLSAELLARLGVHRFVGVVGASGSGKSSLVRAGLLAAIREGALPASETWPCALLTPGREPMGELARALAQPCGVGAEEIRARLDADGVTAFGAFLADAAPQPGGRFVVVVDQFEEVFTLCDDLEQRALFLQLLTTGVGDTDSPLSVVIAVRADFYGRLAEDADLAALLTGSVLVGSMERDELRRAIEEPARIAGLALEPALVDRILLDVADEPGALPLLSTALLGTWERRRGATLTVSGYAAAGGVHGALARLAEDVYARFDGDEQRVARDIFLRLAEPGQGTDDVRRRAPLDELVADDTHAEVLSVLVERRLVVTGEHNAEVAHEALLREWPRLRNWLEEDRDGRRLHHRVAAAAIDWDTSGRDPTELYRGTRLDAALDWSTTHPSEANPLEREFLEAADVAHGHELRTARQSARRLRSLAVALAVLLIVALVAGTVALVQQRNADQEAARATRSAALARSTQLATLARTLPTAQTDLALLLGVEGRRLQPSLTTDGGLEAAITHRPPHLERVLHFDTTAAYATLSDNGRLLAAPGIDGNIRIYDFTTGRLRRTLPGQGQPALVAAFNHDASLVATGSASGKVTIWRVATGKPIGPPVMPGGTIVYGVFDRADELVIVSDNGSLARWDLRDPARPIPIGEPFTVHVGMGDVPLVAFGGADGQLLAAGGLTEQRTTIWDVTTHRQVGNELPGSPGRFSPDGSTITTVSANRVLLWDAATGAQRGTLDLGSHGVSSAPPAFSRDGRLLATADADDNAIRVFDVASGQPISEPLAFHAASVALMVFLPDGRLVTAGANEAAVWRLDTLARPLETIVNGNRGGTAGTLSPALGQFTPDGTEVITVGFADHRVLAWDAVTGAPHGDLLGGRISTVGLIDFSPDAKIIVSAGLDGSFSLWNRTGERELATVDTGQTGVVGVAWDPHRPIVVTTGAPGSVLFWDVSNPRHPVEQRRRALTAPAGFPRFSPDGRFLVVVGAGPPSPSATVFDVRTGHRLLTFGGGAILPQVSFTPDSAILAAAIGQFNITGEVVLWDTTTWHRRATLILPYSPGGIAFINDGTRFATPSILPAIGRIDLWDTATLQPVGEPLTAPTTESVFAIADARGTKIAIGSYSGITTVLDVDPRSWQRAACRLAGRNLTRTEWKQYVPGQSYRKTCPQWRAGR